MKYVKMLQSVQVQIENADGYAKKVMAPWMEVSKAVLDPTYYMRGIGHRQREHICKDGPHPNYLNWSTIFAHMSALGREYNERVLNRDKSISV